MNIIIPILVGSVIGYLTNWLAIKMIFRPLEEKRILGIRIPFTPGLIPKERNRVAKSIGEAVGMHILTPKKITEIVSNKETKKKLGKFIKSKIDLLKDSDNNLKNFLNSVDYQLPIEKLSDKIYNIAISKLKDEEINNIIGKFLKEEIYPLYKGKVISKISVDGENIIQEIKASKAIEKFFIDDIHKKLNELKDTDIILSDVLDKDIISKLEKTIDMNKKEIMEGFRELFYKEDIQRVVSSSIEDLVEVNLSKMITMFVDSKTISEKILIVIKKYIDSEESEIAASYIMKDTIRNLMNTKVATITEKSASIIDEKDIILLYKETLNYILNYGNIGKIIDLIIGNINKNEEEIKGKVDYYFKDILGKISNSEKIKKIFKDGIEKNINGMLESSFSSIFRDFKEEDLEKILIFTNNIMDKGFKDHLYEIVNLFDISKEIEDEINSFEVKYIEELILEIADRELKAITRLGALIGAIMGLLMPLLQVL